MGTTGGRAGDDVAGGRSTSCAVAGAVGAFLVAANALLVLPAGLGMPAVGVFGVIPVLALDVVAVVVVVVLAGRGDPPLAGTLMPRRYPGAARTSAGLLVAWAVATVAGDSFSALVAAPSGLFALTMSLFRTAAVWWRWCARAAAMSLLTWPMPVLVGLRLDRDALEGWGVGLGSLVAMLLVGLTVALAGGQRPRAIHSSRCGSSAPIVVASP